MQYAVTQQEQMEPPYQNEYWRQTQEGLYVDIVSGEPLFSTRDQLRSESGRPWFRKSVMTASVTKKEATEEIKVYSREAHSYLGRRLDRYYEINAVALRFIRRDNLEREGYGDCLILFQLK